MTMILRMEELGYMGNRQGNKKISILFSFLDSLVHIRMAEEKHAACRTGKDEKRDTVMAGSVCVSKGIGPLYCAQSQMYVETTNQPSTGLTPCTRESRESLKRSGTIFSVCCDGFPRHVGSAEVAHSDGRSLPNVSSCVHAIPEKS